MTNEPETAETIERPETSIEPEPEAPAGPDLGAIRDLVLRAHPDVVPELIAGETVDELLASVAPAQAAWQRLADRLGPAATPPVPAGGERPVAVDPERLSPGEKIRRGLARGR
jgi:hypothetical protein